MNDIKKYYEGLEDFQFKNILTNAKGLKSEMFPILKAELEKRNLKEELIMFDAFLTQLEVKEEYSKLSLEEVRKLVDERLDRGESIESVKTDLSNNDVDIDELLENDREKKRIVHNTILTMKEYEFSDKRFKEVLNDKFDLKEEDLSEVNRDLKRKGWMNLMFGILLILVSIIWISIRHNVSSILFSFAALVAGIALIRKGKKYIGAIS